MKFVIGLGNPGAKYEHTRHNIGFCILDALHLTFHMEKKFHAAIAKHGNVIFCKPQTMMNNSGRAVQALLSFYHAEPRDLLVVYDDKDLSFGRIRVRTSGSSAGHNGVQSIIDALGTVNFSRLRIGIAGTRAIRNTAAYVLRNFTKTEERDLPIIIKNAHEIIQQFITSTKPLQHHDTILDIK